MRKLVLPALCLFLAGCPCLVLEDDDAVITVIGKSSARVVQCACTLGLSEALYSDWRRASSQDEKVYAEMRLWLGRDIRQLVKEWGMPTCILDVPGSTKGDRMYAYEMLMVHTKPGVAYHYQNPFIFGSAYMSVYHPPETQIGYTMPYRFWAGDDGRIYAMWWSVRSRFYKVKTRD